MSRRNGSQPGVRPRAAVRDRPPSKQLPCDGGCGGTVGPWWSFDLRCWTALNFAPNGLKGRLSVPDGVSPRACVDPAYLAAAKEARKYLADRRAAAK
jgi:hypothetical protein